MRKIKVRAYSENAIPALFVEDKGVEIGSSAGSRHVGNDLSGTLNFLIAPVPDTTEYSGRDSFLDFEDKIDIAGILYKYLDNKSIKINGSIQEISLPPETLARFSEKFPIPLRLKEAECLPAPLKPSVVASINRFVSGEIDEYILAKKADRLFAEALQAKESTDEQLRKAPVFALTQAGPCFFFPDEAHADATIGELRDLIKEEDIKFSGYILRRSEEYPGFKLEKSPVFSGDILFCGRAYSAFEASAPADLDPLRPAVNAAVKDDAEEELKFKLFECSHAYLSAAGEGEEKYRAAFVDRNRSIYGSVYTNMLKDPEPVEIEASELEKHILKAFDSPEKSGVFSPCTIRTYMEKKPAPVESVEIPIKKSGKNAVLFVEVNEKSPRFFLGALYYGTPPLEPSKDSIDIPSLIRRSPALMKYIADKEGHMNGYLYSHDRTEVPLLRNDSNTSPRVYGHDYCADGRGGRLSRYPIKTITKVTTVDLGGGRTMKKTERIEYDLAKNCGALTNKCGILNTGSLFEYNESLFPVSDSHRFFNIPRRRIYDGFVIREICPGTAKNTGVPELLSGSITGLLLSPSARKAALENIILKAVNDYRRSEMTVRFSPERPPDFYKKDDGQKGMAKGRAPEARYHKLGTDRITDGALDPEKTDFINELDDCEARLLKKFDPDTAERISQMAERSASNRMFTLKRGYADFMESAGFSLLPNLNLNEIGMREINNSMNMPDALVPEIDIEDETLLSDFISECISQLPAEFASGHTNWYGKSDYLIDRITSPFEGLRFENTLSEHEEEYRSRA